MTDNIIYFTESQINDIYNSKVKKTDLYFSRQLITCPVKVWNYNWKDHDAPRCFCIIDFILKLTKSNSMLIFCPLPSDDPTNRKPDIQRAQSILDWNPEYNLIDGITKTIDYFITT